MRKFLSTWLVYTLFGAVAVLVLDALPLVAFAQVGLPASIDPGRVTEQLSRQPAVIPTKKAPRVKVEKPKEQIASEKAKKIKFHLGKLEILGNTIIPTEELKSLYQQYEGKTISLAQLQGVAQAITKKYREKGYVLSKAIIPPQRITKEGIVKIQVVEGFVDEVNVSGKVRDDVRKLLMAYGDHIEASRPLRIKVLERYALLANDLPGITARTILSPSKTTPGAATLTFVVKQKYINVYAAYDNRGTKFLGPQQMSAGLTLNSIVISNGRTNFRTVITKETRELRFFELSHTQQLGNDGTTVRVSAEDSRTHPTFTLAESDIAGDSQAFAIIFSHPFIRSRKTNLYVDGGFRALNSKSTVLSSTPQISTLFEDRIRSLKLGFSINHLDSFRGVTAFTANLWQGLDQFGARGTGSRLLSRPQGRADYTKIDVNTSRLQGITQHISFLLAAQGQYAFNPLLSAIQFGVGGSQFGQAYDPSAIVGDSGFTAKGELRYDWRPNKIFLRTVQFFGFYDGGVVWNRDLASQRDQEDLTSTGGGVRVHFTSHLSASLMYAKPLTYPVATAGNRHARYFFSIVLTG